jgi:hypothetical protein
MTADRKLAVGSLPKTGYDAVVDGDGAGLANSGRGAELSAARSE